MNSLSGTENGLGCLGAFFCGGGGGVAAAEEEPPLSGVEVEAVLPSHHFH